MVDEGGDSDGRQSDKPKPQENVDLFIDTLNKKVIINDTIEIDLLIMKKVNFSLGIYF